jgi:cysteine synthase A
MVEERKAAGERVAFGNQFETLNNAAAHYETTGRELWEQSVAGGGRGVDALVCAAGTGGTINGVTGYLREQNPNVRCYLIDPPGSSLANYVATGVMEPMTGSTITEGIGIARRTSNFDGGKARLDGAFAAVSDQETVFMAHYLWRHEGVGVGSSAALNVLGAVKTALCLGPGHTVATILCDGKERYESKMFNPAWLVEKGLSAGDFAAGDISFVTKVDPLPALSTAAPEPAATA